MRADAVKLLLDAGERGRYDAEEIHAAITFSRALTTEIETEREATLVLGLVREMRRWSTRPVSELDTATRKVA
jgi:hypothetical protein